MISEYQVNVSENESHGHYGHIDMTVLNALKQRWEEVISHGRLKKILRQLIQVEKDLMGR